jgi:hypothetical protein
MTAPKQSLKSLAFTKREIRQILLGEALLLSSFQRLNLSVAKDSVLI